MHPAKLSAKIARSLYLHGFGINLQNHQCWQASRNNLGPVFSIRKYDSLGLYKTQNTKENILYAIFLTTFRTCLLCSQAALTGAVVIPRRLILGAWGWHPCLAMELPGKLWTKQAVTARVLCGGLEAYPGYGLLVVTAPNKWPIRIKQTKQYVMQDMQEKKLKKKCQLLYSFLFHF